MPVANSLENFGFSLAPLEIPHRLIAAINGHRGKGKTHQGLTAPGPIALFNLDLGLSGVVQKFRREGKIVVVNDMKVPATQQEAVAEWERFLKAWTAALRARDIRSIVIDTESELWELIRMARFGALTQIMPYMYTPVNAEYGRTLREIMTSDKNLILLRHVKPVYINDKRTKEYEAAGFGGVEKIVEVVADVWREEEADTPTWNLTITKCRSQPTLDGETLSGIMASFPWLAAQAIEGTSVEDWE